MYAGLLAAVLAHPVEWRDLSRPPDPLADLGRIRRALEEHLFRSDPGWALQAVADQLAYDVALIRLARREGIEPDHASFNVPDLGRDLLADALGECGISLPPVAEPFQRLLGGPAPTSDPEGSEGIAHDPEGSGTGESPAADRPEEGDVIALRLRTGDGR